MFNADFDSHLVKQTSAAFGESAAWWSEVDERCAMELAAEMYGARHDYGLISLAGAMRKAGVTFTRAALTGGPELNG